MAVYEYLVIDKKGRERKGIINADSIPVARDKLRAQGFYPSSLTEIKTRKAYRQRKKIQISLSRVPFTELVAAIRQLATLLSAGLPLVTSLNALLQQMKDSQLKRVLAQVRERVNEGSSFAAALEEHPRVFNQTMTAMVRAGENTGTQELVLERLADFGEQQLELRRKIQSTLAYPILMLLVGLGVVFFLMSYVIPKVTEIFFELEQALPLPTIILIKVSSFLQNFWWVYLPFIGLLFFLIRWFLTTTKGKWLLDRAVLKLPIFGTIARKMAIARFARTLGTLVKNEVPLLHALTIVRSVVNNGVIAQTVDQVSKQVSEGQSMVTPLAQSGVFPSTVVQMVASGEQSGQLGDMLMKAAQANEAEVSSRLAIMTALMEPVMILFLGSIVGFVVLAVLLPIFEMSHLVR